MSKTKGELVAAAFRKAQISGITSQPTGDELAGAMETLEDMMRELDSKNACVNYEYEDEPCLGTESGLESKWYHAVQSRLAVLLCSDYGIEPSQTLMAQSRQAWSSMIGKLTLPRQNVQPRTMPRGSGNTVRFGNWSRYYQGDNRAPIDCDTVKMRVDETFPLTVSFEGYLAGSEVITSYQIKEQSSGITLSSQQLGEDAQSVELVVIGKRAGTQSLIIEITTSLGRVYPEKVWFTVEEL
tara:strand:- start:2860 stop:3579 length:720 start_codon:yes stop_codon:yes gene_type:complete